MAGGSGHLGDVRGLCGAVHSRRDGGLEQTLGRQGTRTRCIACIGWRNASCVERLSGARRSSAEGSGIEIARRARLGMALECTRASAFSPACGERVLQRGRTGSNRAQTSSGDTSWSCSQHSRLSATLAPNPELKAVRPGRLCSNECRSSARYRQLAQRGPQASSRASAVLATRPAA